MTRKAMIYTTFAILSSSLLLLMASLPVTGSGVKLDSSEATRIGEASFFMESVLSDMERSLSIATRRALTASTNYVVETGNELGNPPENVSSALVNGSISGKELNLTENASLTEWSERVAGIASRSGYDLEIRLRDASFNASGFRVHSSYSIFARLEDPETLAAFNRTRTENTSVSISGLEDTMLLLQSKGRYVSLYKKCRLDRPAEKIYTGSPHSSGAVQGRAVVKPADASSVDNRSESIIVAEDIDNYAVSDVNNFAGAVSAQPNSSSGYTTQYVFDTGDISDISENKSYILNQDQVWRSVFRKMIEEDCYVTSERGPDFIDRLGNEMVSGSGKKGIATFIDLEELPSELQKEESAVGYAYFNESGYSGSNSINGVTSEYSWFEIDDYHVDQWNLDELAS